MGRSIDPRKRFFAKTAIAGNDGCWEWGAHKGHNGYGQMKFGEKIERAHRISWMLFKGEIPADKQVLHKCDNRGCVNPNHLWLGTNLENRWDMVSKGRHGGTKLTDENVREIRALRVEGLKLQEIADFYSVTKSTIWTIVTGKSRSYVV